MRHSLELPTRPGTFIGDGARNHLRVFIGLVLLMGLFIISPGERAQATSWGVTDTASLNAAITAANAETSGTHTITFDDDITLSAASTPIDLQPGVTLVIEGAGYSLDGAGAYRGFTISGGAVEINNLNIAHGSADDGGGIYNADGSLSVSDSTFSSNSASNFGGGIYNDGGTLNVTGSSFFDNSAASHGGGVFNATSATATVTDSIFSTNTSYHAGGILNAGVMTLSSSTLSGNSADGNGGGMENAGTMEVTNSTLYGNHADNLGGGIYGYEGTLTVTNSTFADNSADNDGGGISNFDASTLNLINTILADSTAGVDCHNTGTMGTDVNNLIEANSGCGTLVSADDPLLGTLQDNGGPTDTMAIDHTSPAYDAGDDGDCPATDQRGETRPQGAACDIGAYEATPPTELTVNSINDPGDGICDLSECTLREAIAVLAPGGTIEFDAGLSGGTITLGSKVDIDKDLTIDGSSLDPHIIISGGDTVRVFYFGSGVTATLIGLDITQGYDAFTGGGIHNDGTLTVTDGNFSSNNSYDGGGLYNNGTLTVTDSTFSGNNAHDGSGIYNNAGGILGVADSTFSGNSATVNGGGIDNHSSSTSTVTGSTFSGNTAQSNGGGIHNYGTMEVTNSTLVDNHADNEGGGIFGYPGTLTVTNSTFSGNSATVNGGGLSNYSGSTLHLINTILADSTSGGDCYNIGTLSTDVSNLIEANSGCGTPVSSGDPLLGPLQDNGGLTHTMAIDYTSPAFDAGDDGLCPATDQRGEPRPQGAACDIGAYEAAPHYTELTVNSYDDPGDGICDLSECTLREAVAEIAPGGTIDFDAGLSGDTITLGSTLIIDKELTIDGTSLTTNVVISGDDSVRVFYIDAVIVTLQGLEIAHGSADNGGGIYNDSGTLTVTDSTFSGNSAPTGGGGAIHNSGELTLTASTFSGNSAMQGGAVNNQPSATSTVTNSTFSTNSTDSFGGGIINTGILTVTNSSFSGNSASGAGGGIYNDSLGTLNLINTVLADSTNGDCVNDGAVGTDVHNLIEANSGCGIPVSSDDPLLGPLQDNGGPTHTMAIDHTSPAYDAGDDGDCPATDQRGEPRPQGAACDIGAFEATPPTELTVNSYIDPGDGICDLSECTLREAITVIAPGGTIDFDAGLSGETITLGSTLSILKELTIDGSALAAHIVISGGDSVSVFMTSTSGTVVLQGLDITHGFTSSMGGGIYHSFGTLNVMDCTVSLNSATLHGGGILNNDTLILSNSTLVDNTAGGDGGAIENDSTLEMTNSTLEGNHAGNRGGGVFGLAGEMTVTNSTFSGNSADNDGGGVYNDGGSSLSLINTILANSNSGADCYNIGSMGTDVHNLIGTNNGCGTPVSSDDPLLGSLQDNGGPTHTMAIDYTSPAYDAGDDGFCPDTDQRGEPRPQGAACDIGAFEATPPPTELTVNSHVDPGDGICDLSECTLREAISEIAPGGTIDFDAEWTGDTITLGSTLTIDKDLTIDGTSLTSHVIISGGDSVRVFDIDAATVTLQGLEITHGSAVDGGGIYNAGGSLTLTDSSLSSNSASNAGGGIYNDSGTLTVTDSTFSDNSAPAGGGGAIRNGDTLTLMNCTFSGNSAMQGGAVNNQPSATSTVTNSTFSANSTVSFGGGIVNGGILTVTNSTFSANSAGVSGGGVYNGSLGTLNLVNTIMADSTAGVDCHNIGTMGTDVHNLIETNTDCGVPVSTDDPLLGPLQDNGGPTHTMAIDYTSPAFDAGDDGLCPATDQRGELRPMGNACDIGAFEAHPILQTVNSYVDPGDGICDLSECTLREAIAVIAPGGTIDFDVGLSEETITLGSTLTIDKDLTIDGSSLDPHIVISGGDAVRVFYFGPDVTAALVGLDITHGKDIYAGGGIYNEGVLTVTDSNISYNWASDGISYNGNGGGIYNNGTLTVTGSTFSSNGAGRKGGGIYNAGMLTVTGSTLASNGSSGYKSVWTPCSWYSGEGGGIYNTGTLEVSDSTFSGNTATDVGGGIYNVGISTVTSSTLSGNTSPAKYVCEWHGGYGGGIYNGGTLTATNNTFSDNYAYFNGSGIFNWGGTLHLVNTILANSTGEDCYSSITPGTDVHNLIEVNNGCGTPVSSDDPLLGPLQDNGGPTHTMAIDHTSPAFDAGDDGLCPATDQRGVPRPQESACDIGAFEAYPTITVNSLNDPGDGTCDLAECTLREAIEFLDPGGTIDFDAGLSGDTITLGSTLIIDQDLTIDGSALASHIIISGGSNVRVFYINSSVTVTLAELDIANGHDNSIGGGIYNEGTLTMTDCTLSYNNAGYTYCGYWGCEWRGGSGGGIYNQGTLEVTSSTLTGNLAGSGGGIFDEGTFVLTNTILSGNQAKIEDCDLSGCEWEAGWGGGIYNAGGSLTVADSTFLDNTSYYAGGIHNSGVMTLSGSTLSGNSAVGNGGGIENAGTMEVTNCTLSGNHADNLGGGIQGYEGTLTVTNSTLASNSADNEGGGIYNNNTSTLNLINTILADSTAGVDCYNMGTMGTDVNNLIEDNSSCGTPVSTDDPLLASLQDNGGPTHTMAIDQVSPAYDAGDDGLCPATDQRGVPRPQGAACDIGAFEGTPLPTELTVNSFDDPGDGICDLTECTLREAISEIVTGGTIDFDAGLSGDTITLGSALTIGKNLTIDGSSLDPHIIISGGDTVRVFYFGTGVTATLIELDITHGYDVFTGGGIHNDGTLTVTDINFLSNNAGDNGGGLYNNGTLTVADSTISLNTAFHGGGIFNIGMLTITGSTLSDNTAAGHGGGLANDGDGTLILINSTLSGNHADIQGGGVFGYYGSVTVTNSTFAGNSADAIGGGISNYDYSTLNLINTILADSTASVDCYNTVTMGTDVNNLIEANSGCGTPLSSDDPALGPLQDNGGPTDTMAIDHTSAAFDAGDNGLCPATDQRGEPRPQGAACDIGAYEAEPNTPPDTPSNPTPADSAVDVPTDAVLSWDGGDPDGDPVTYDVYFDADDPTPETLLCDDASTTNCDPGDLSYSTTYYWYVEASDGWDTATGPVWSFTTESYVPIELLLNTDLEVVVPSPWKGDKLETVDGSDCTVAHGGSCAAALTGSSGPTKMLFYGLPGFSGSAGDTFNLSYYNRRQDVGGAGAVQVRVSIRYTDATMGHFSFVPGVGTADWALYSHDFTAAKDYDWGVVRLIFSKPNGTLWYDDMSLMRNTSEELLDNGDMEIRVPSGWKGDKLTLSDGADCTEWHSGTCSAALTGTSGETKMLFYGIPGFSGSAGDVFTLSYWNKRQDVGGAGAVQVRVSIRYTDATMGHFSFVPGVGTADWEYFWHEFTAAKDYDWGVIRLIFSKPNGTLWYDQISLTR